MAKRPDGYVRNWFSNMISLRKPLLYDGLLYRTPEHFYQAMKTADKHERAKIAFCKDGIRAKKMGRRVEIRGDWEDVKIDVMRFVQEYRFSSDEKMREMLLSTEGEIVEWNYWCDNFWGVCTCGKCNGGENNLGKILMKIRDDLTGMNNGD